MNKSMKPSQPVARQQVTPLTPEEQKEQFMRAYMQKKASLAEGILFNLCQNPALFNPDKNATAYGICAVRAANDMADEFMRVVYHQDVKIAEDQKED